MRSSSSSRSPAQPGSRARSTIASRRWRSPSTGRRSRCRPGAARSTTAPASRSRSASRRRPSTPTRGTSSTRSAPRSSPARRSASTPTSSIPSLKDRTKGFVYVARKADPTKAEALSKREIPGLGFYPEELRTYPQGAVASHVLGFAGTDNHGLDGLERSLDKTLSGRPGFETIVKDPFGRAIDVVTSRPERAGKNVTLTIDHQIQSNAEQILAQTVRNYRARGGAAIVMDPRTGAILAMANYPTFNSNDFSTASPDARRNRAVTDAYEPGSTFKIVTIAGALEDNVVSPASTFTLAPTIQVADRVIHEAHLRGTEVMSVRDILAQSSNVGTITIAEKLGANGLASWVDRFGFGHQTGIDYPGESSGLVLPLEKWSGSTIGTVPIGQGIAVTPLQMVVGLRDDRQRRRPRHPASRREGRQQARARGQGNAGRLDAHGRPDDGHVPRRGARGHRYPGRDSRLHGRRQDRHRAEGRERAAT